MRVIGGEDDMTARPQRCERRQIVPALAALLLVQASCVPGVGLDQLEGGHHDDSYAVDAEEVDGAMPDEASDEATTPDEVDSADADVDAPEAALEDADVEVDAVDAEVDAAAEVDAEVEADAPPLCPGWLDEATHLCWVIPSGTTGVSWAAASESCTAFTGPWRLPTISELRTLVRGCSAQATGGSCGVTDTCTNTSPTGCWAGCGECPVAAGPYDPPELETHGRWYWSSTMSDLARPWGLAFTNAAIYPVEVSCVAGTGSCTAICVREVL